MLGIWERRSARTEFGRAVDDVLKMLFAGFPMGALSAVQGSRDIEKLKRIGYSQTDSSAAECAIMIARVLLEPYAKLMSPSIRENALTALEVEDRNNPIEFGRVHMVSVASLLTDTTNARLISYELAGQLRGLSRQEIDNWWCETEVGSIFNAKRAF